MNNDITNNLTSIDRTNYVTDEKSKPTSTEKSGISKEFTKMLEGLTQVLPKSLTTLMYISEDLKRGDVLDAGLDLFVGSLLFPATFVGSLGGVLISTTYRLIKSPFASDKNKTETTEAVEKKEKDTNNQIKEKTDDLINNETDDLNIILKEKTDDLINNETDDLNIILKEKTTKVVKRPLPDIPIRKNVENRETENMNNIKEENF